MLSSSGKIRNSRRSNGNMLILSLVVIGFIGLIIGTFGLNFVSLLAGNHEQKTAIEAAALAAADALSTVVVEDPELGFVSLADGPPTGTATRAEDNYYLPVSSINSLIGRTRLDLIIADQLQDDFIKGLVLADYDKVMRAKNTLVAELNKCCSSGGTGLDAAGKTINIYDTAVNAYKSNAVRIVGPKSAMEAGSLKLKLGTIVGVPSNCRAPFPDKFASAPADSFQDGFYKASLNVPLQQKDFVFAASADHSTLIDASKFQTSVDGLPYMIPSAVFCEANHDLVRNSGEKNTVKSSACAIAGASNQEIPHSGFLCFNFSAGKINKYTSPKSLLWSTEVGHSPADLLQTAVGGDYPPSTLQDTQVDGSSTHPLMEHLLKRGLYDWMKRGGSRMNVQSFLDMLQNPFPGGVSNSTPQIARYDVDQSGNINATAVETGSRYFLPVSNNQIFARTEFAVKDDTGKFYDLFIRDYVYKGGRASSQGGLHAGETLLVNDFMGPPAKPDEPKGTYNKSLDQDPTLAASFPTAPGGNRDTYLKPGVAVEFKLRLR
ncbi:MAG: hypothetical protein IPK73_20950 [Candidatus Obscuribacter sp.]|nr:hypothetical protein [Candidatus Obscuribacter sp.]MBK9276586.1 hypothetical protein [Candidatus Obscuribacter sp.]